MQGCQCGAGYGELSRLRGWPGVLASLHAPVLSTPVLTARVLCAPACCEKQSVYACAFSKCAPLCPRAPADGARVFIVVDTNVLMSFMAGLEKTFEAYAAAAAASGPR